MTTNSHSNNSHHHNDAATATKELVFMIDHIKLFYFIIFCFLNKTKRVCMPSISTS